MLVKIASKKGKSVSRVKNLYLVQNILHVLLWKFYNDMMEMDKYSKEGFVMKKRGVYILLAIVLIINLAACGTEKPEARAANAFVEKEMVRGPEIEKNDINLEEYLPKSDIDAMEDWQKAYATFLMVYQEDFDSEHPVDSPRFNLVYIDEDEIPELAVMVGTAHVNGVDIYGYCEGEVVLIGGSYGGFGSFAYVPKENLIASHYMGQGVLTSIYYQIEKGKEKELLQLVSQEGYSPDMYLNPDCFLMNDEPVTKEEYETQRELYEGGKEFVLLGYEDSYSIDEAAIQSVFDRER